MTRARNIVDQSAEGQRYDINAQAFGPIDSGTIFGQFVSPTPYTIEASGSPLPHTGYAVTAPGGSPIGSPPAAVITVTKEGVSIGTLIFDSGSNSLSSSTISETSVAAGQRLQFTLTEGNGIEDFSVTLAAVL